MDDSPFESNRLLALEATVDEMRNQNEATHTLLQDLLRRLGPAQAETAQSPTRQSPGHRPPLTPSAPTSSAGRKKVSLKPALPPDFSGDRAAGKAFLNACRTYIRLCPEAFEDDESVKILWAMSYMKTGRAARWASRELEAEAREGNLRFLDWPDFEDEFRKDFLPLDAEAAAINTLETTAYFQGKRSVDDYLDQFKDLIEDSGYTDPKTIVVKFRRGLDRRIQSALAGMATGRPSDAKPEAWYRLAVQMDQNRAADEAFQASYRQTPAPVTIPPQATIPMRTVPTARFAHSNPTPGNPVPMDIDAARKAKTLPDVCKRCGKTGHWAKDCGLRFDVRHMDLEELQSAVQEKMVALDVAETSGQLAEEEEECTLADFVSRSG
jgi:Retrotransposon gag protein/Zinc knuckle